ncbi:MAG TPA: hypothetical protein VHO50_09745 [Bacteroidales bacterium]|nr:hypothetical protein [Bacteroidales bacterium]
MKKITFMLSFVLISTWAFSQAPNFSGEWTLDPAKSKMSAEFSMAPTKLKIEQNGNAMKVEKTSSFMDQTNTTTENLTLDGKESTNEAFMGSQKKSTAVVADDKKSIKVVSKIVFDGGEVNTTEVYRMDGNNLVIDTKSTSSFGDQDESYVYVKK